MLLYTTDRYAVVDFNVIELSLRCPFVGTRCFYFLVARRNGHLIDTRCRHRDAMKNGDERVSRSRRLGVSKCIRARIKDERKRRYLEVSKGGIDVIDSYELLVRISFGLDMRESCGEIFRSEKMSTVPFIYILNVCEFTHESGVSLTWEKTMSITPGIGIISVSSNLPLNYTIKAELLQFLQRFSGFGLHPQNILLIIFFTNSKKELKKLLIQKPF